MSETRQDGRRLYKARDRDGEVAWVDHDELWRLQQSQAERVRRERARRRRLMLLALAGLVVVALALVLVRLGVPRGAPMPGGEPAVAGLPSAAAEPAELAAGESGRAGEHPTEPDASERVAEAVSRWASAWAERDVAAYLAAYSETFAPADGSSRSSWMELRRRRLTAPAWIRVEIDELAVVRDGGRAEVRLLQSYGSPDYSDVVRKTLELVEEEGAWRIVSERAEAP